MALSILITPCVKVEVGVHYSKFVKVFKNHKFISLCAKTWRFVTNNLQEIDSCLKQKSVFELICTETKSLNVGEYRDEAQVKFCEKFTVDGVKCTKYVCLSVFEWDMLKLQLTHIERLLNYDVVKQEEEHGEWSLYSPKFVSDEKTRTTTKRLVPRMCETSFSLQLCTYLVTQEINEIVKTSCHGCTTNSDKTELHGAGGFGEGCQATWPEKVNNHFDTAKGKIDLSKAVKCINESLALKTELSDLPSESKLRSCVLDHKVIETCAACTELLPIYWDFYKKVLC